MNRRFLLFPNVYPWFLLMAAMDIVFTWVVLALGGQELNLFAAHLLERHGFIGMVWLKCLSVLVVVAICEVVGRGQRVTGLNLARCSVLVTCVPVVVAATQLVSAGLY